MQDPTPNPSRGGEFYWNEVMQDPTPIPSPSRGGEFYWKVSRGEGSYGGMKNHFLR